MTKTARTKAEEAHETDPIFGEATSTLAVSTPAQPAAVRHISDGLTLHSNDQPINRVKLVQGTSAVGTPGRFLFPDGEEEVDFLVIVPVKVTPTRALWSAAGFSRDSKPECASYGGVFADLVKSDGVTPTLFAGQPCSRCEYFVSKPWLAEPGQRICSSGYEVVAISVSTLELISLRLSGTGNKIVRTLSRHDVFRKRPVKLSAERVSNDKGTWYQIKPEVQEPLSKEQLATIQEVLLEQEPDVVPAE
jgi:hypothetical protein